MNQDIFFDFSKMAKVGPIIRPVVETAQEMTSTPAPNSMMYGQMVGAAASMEEPALTEARSNFYQGVADHLKQISAAAEDTIANYRETEDRNVEAANRLLEQLNHVPQC